MFEIVAGSDFFYDRSGSSCTCTFYCQTSDGAFPDCEWTDFAHTVLTWWSEAVAQAACAVESSFKLLFEDGPYWIDVSKQGDLAALRFRTGRRADAPGRAPGLSRAGRGRRAGNAPAVVRPLFRRQSERCAGDG